MFSIWSFLIIFTKQPTNSGLEIQYDWTKRLQKLPENFSLSLANKKMVEKNEWKFSNQSGEVMHASIYLKNCRRSFFFFRLCYLEYDFMIANLVR